MKLKRIILFLLAIPLLSFVMHKYYVSLTQIEYKKESKSVQIMMDVFTDDIESAMNDTYNINLQLESKRELKDANNYFKKYLSMHFKIKIDGKQVSYNFIGKEYDEKRTRFYLEIPNINSIKTITVRDNVLMKHFPKQQNLIKLKVNHRYKSLLLTKGNDAGLLKFLTDT